MKKLFFFVVLCLCLSACGTFNVNVKVLPTQVPLLPTDVVTATSVPIQPTATDDVPTASPTRTEFVDQPFALANIQMRDTSNGWGVDTLGRIITTNNGAGLWQDVTPSEESFDRHSLFAFSDKLAWAVSSQFESSHQVWRTLDGGANWKASQPVPLGDGTYAPIRLQFPTVNDGWMLLLAENENDGSRLLLYASHDGGNAWEQVNTISSGQARSYLPVTSTDMAFLDGERGWLGGDWANGEWLMLKTGDGAASWGTDSFRLPTEQRGVTCNDNTVPETEPGSMAVEVICTKAKDAKYLYHHIYYLSKNTGDTWQSWALPGKFLSIDFANMHQGWMVVGTDDPLTNKLISTRDGGGTWKTLTKVTWQQAQLNFVTDKIGWALTWNGFTAQLFRTEDTGKTWITVRPLLQH